MRILQQAALLIFFIAFALHVYAQDEQSQETDMVYVNAVAWSPDGTKVAVPVNDIVEVWDTATEQMVHMLRGHTDSISAVAWSPDSRMIATVSSDQTVRLWTADGSLLHTLSGHEAPVTAVAWSQDGSQVVSSGLETEPSLFVWDAATGALLERHNSGDIVVVAFSPDGEKIALSTSLEIGTINAQTFEAISGSPRVMCCANQMYSLAWSPYSNTLITGSINGLVTLWDASTGQMLNQFIANPDHEPDSRDVDNLALSWVRDVAFAPDGSTVLSASGDGTVREWNASTGDLLQETQIAPLYSAAWSPYTGRLAVLVPNPAEALALSSEQEFDASNVTGTLNIVVPAPSLERLQTIANACDAPAPIEQSLTASIQANQLTDFVAQVEALPEDTLPPACAADLIAVARALHSQ